MNHPHLLEVKHFDKKFRLGSAGDGGYVIADLEGGYDCYISAGVGEDESFSRDFISKYGLNASNSVAYDATIHQYPHHYTQDITFIRKNVGTVNGDTTTNFSQYTDQYSNIFLKMDIEGWEYPWLFGQTEKQLRAFKQIAIELHGLTSNGYGCDYGDKIKCLEKLANTHYIIHAHGNNCGGWDGSRPDLLEITYVRKSEFVEPPAPNAVPLPIPGLDFPNGTHMPDFVLNYYPFIQ